MLVVAVAVVEAEAEGEVEVKGVVAAAMHNQRHYNEQDVHKKPYTHQVTFATAYKEYNSWYHPSPST